MMLQRQRRLAPKSPIRFSVFSNLLLFVLIIILNGPTSTQGEDDSYDDDDNTPPVFKGDNFKNGGWQFNIKESVTGKDDQLIGVVEASDVSLIAKNNKQSG